MREKLVSVIIPTYNRAKKIFYSIDSVLRQTYNNLEIIVVDDGSEDETEKVVRSINDERIKYVYQKNAGACAARNKGIEIAKGDYIALNDSDDIWHENKLQKQISILEEKTNVDIVFCKLSLLSNKEKTLLPGNIQEGIVDKADNFFGIGTQTIVARKDVFKNNFFDEKMPRYQDLELLIRLSKKYCIYCVEEGLVDYKINEDSISFGPGKILEACQLIFEKHPTLQVDSPKLTRELSIQLLIASKEMLKLKDGNYKECVLKAFYYHKNLKTILCYIAIKCNVFKILLRYVD